jgi:hypothetical protein
MRRHLFHVALAAAALLLASSTRAHAWGAFHAGFTQVGYGGLHHYGFTTARGPDGAYGVGHVGYRYGGGVYLGAPVSGYGAYYPYAGSYYPYTPLDTGGYAVGGYHPGPVGSFSAGAYRAW